MPKWSGSEGTSQRFAIMKIATATTGGSRIFTISDSYPVVYVRGRRWKKRKDDSSVRCEMSRRPIFLQPIGRQGTITLERRRRTLPEARGDPSKTQTRWISNLSCLISFTRGTDVKRISEVQITAGAVMVRCWMRSSPSARYPKFRSSNGGRKLTGWIGRPWRKQAYSMPEITCSALRGRHHLERWREGEGVGSAGMPCPTTRVSPLHRSKNSNDGFIELTGFLKLGRRDGWMGSGGNTVIWRSKSSCLTSACGGGTGAGPRWTRIRLSFLWNFLPVPLRCFEY